MSILSSSIVATTGRYSPTTTIATTGTSTHNHTPYKLYTQQSTYPVTEVNQRPHNNRDVWKPRELAERHRYRPRQGLGRANRVPQEWDCLGKSIEPINRQQQNQQRQGFACYTCKGLERRSSVLHSWWRNCEEVVGTSRSGRSLATIWADD